MSVTGCTLILTPPASADRGTSRPGAATKGPTAQLFSHDPAAVERAAGRDVPRSVPMVWLCLGLLLSGCASHRPDPAGARRFDFQRDTFAYPNQLVWAYGFDTNGNWVSQRRDPKPEYFQHCFVVARSTRQFFDNARFAPEQPPVDEAAYRRLVRQVLATSPRHPVPSAEQVIIPGYSGLRNFSEAHPKLLKEECGGSWQCYVQRGNWRMVLPFSRHHQEKVAKQLAAQVPNGEPAIVHVVRFPQLTINHALLLFDAKEMSTGIEFTAYDPNEPDAPIRVTFERESRSFLLPRSAYFPGGRVNLYPIYCRWDY